jgi:pimeloyl-ACP methyl ester carboxylesterase
VTLELRGDGSYRQHMKDTSSDGKLEVTQDGAWGISRGQICIYTNVGLCLVAHESGDDLALVRTSGAADDEGGEADEGAETGVAEFFGSAETLRPTDADVVSSPVAEFPVDEVFLPGAKGAAKEPKTLLYYMHGFDGRARAHPPLAEFFVSQLQRTHGWDVIDGAYPRKGVTQVRRFGGANVGVAVFVARRLRELKAQGYQRIYVGGQSWGGWSSLVLDGMRGLPLDGVIMVVPACCGWRSVGANPRDPNFANNKFYFDQLISRARYPTVAIFFRGDEYEPADRGKSAAQTLTERGVPNLIIDHPPGYEGHGSAWFPPFDYQYGEAIATFLSAPKTGPCIPASIAQAKGDFRAVVATSQLRDWQNHIARFDEVKGRRFAIYPAGETRQIADEVRTLVRGFGMGDSVYTSSFKDDLYCFRARIKFAQPQKTDAVCVRLLRWNQHALLGIDPQSGAVLEWWVEMQ